MGRIDAYAAARRLAAFESGPAANAWVMRSRDYLPVDLGDSGEEIVVSWNMRYGEIAPLRHVYAASRDDEDDDDEEGEPFGWLEFGGRRTPYRLRYERATDALLIVHALAQVLRPDFELRFCRDSWGSTVLEFVALAPSDWLRLEQECGRDAVVLRMVAIPAEFMAFERLAMGDPPEWHRAQAR
jgi:hypothetical protein